MRLRSDAGSLVWQALDSRRRLAIDRTDERAAARLAQALCLLWERYGIDLSATAGPSEGG